MTERERLLDLLRERSLEFGDFILSSGVRASYYVDCRRTTMHAEGQVLVGRLSLALFEESGLAPDCIGGLTMGADPVAYAIAHSSWLANTPIHAFSVRKQTKTHGRGKRIEGCFASGNRAVIIEDTITTGGSALDACEAVLQEGGQILAVMSVLDRESGGREAIEAAGFRVVTLFRISELFNQPAPA